MNDVDDGVKEVFVVWSDVVDVEMLLSDIIIMIMSVSSYHGYTHVPRHRHVIMYDWHVDDNRDRFHGAERDEIIIGCELAWMKR